MANNQKGRFSRGDYGWIAQETTRHFELLFGIDASRHIVEFMKARETYYRDNPPHILFRDLTKIMSTMVGANQAQKESASIHNKYRGWKS